jgi:peptidyl-prolyl cis-trans isomerase C
MEMRKYEMRKSAIAICVATLTACSAGGAPDTRIIQLPADGRIAETVNGTAVPEGVVEAVARGRGLHLDKPEQREQALKLTTDFVLMAQAVQRESFSSDPAFRADIEVARLKAIAESGIAAFEKQTPVGDDVLKAQYDNEVGQAGKFEYDFHQLLFADENDALNAEGDLLLGKPFTQVFDAWSAKAKQAKAFTRVRAGQLPAALVEALDSLKDGENTRIPVKTEFGWHVVHRDIANPFTPPAFEQVKETVRRAVLTKAGQQRVEKMREQAKIEYPAGGAPTSAATEKTVEKKG